MTVFLWAAVALAAVLAVALLLARRRELRMRERLGQAIDELERLERSFAQFAPEEIVERVISAGASPAGERREVTALFADLVGSTALADTLAATVLVDILNGYFDRMSTAITSNHGHLSTLIGDGILALFGALGDNPWQSHDACLAALAMRKALEEYNRELNAKGLPALGLGIGLHRGSGVAGLVGSRELVQFTVVGTTVSIAARVQQLTRDSGADVLITKAVAQQLDARFDVELRGPANLRGISEPIELFALRAFSTT
jgi:class 3 adenylate cyclase